MAEQEDDEESTTCSYEPEYEWERIEIDEFQVQVQSLLPPPLEYMSMLHSQTKEISGRKVWCGSYLLAQALCHIHKQEPNMFTEKRILELGSGTGLVGMILSKMATNPTCITLTDGDTEVMTLLQQNIQHSFNRIDSATVKECLLRWGQGDESSNQTFRTYCRNEWKNVFSSKKIEFDVIVAGDVMYKKELPQLFFETVNEYLTATGTLWLCHVPRASVTQQVVRNAAQAAGFTVETYQDYTKDQNIHSNSGLEGLPREDMHRSVIYRVTRRRPTT